MAGTEVERQAAWAGVATKVLMDTVVQPSTPASTSFWKDMNSERIEHRKNLAQQLRLSAYAKRLA